MQLVSIIRRNSAIITKISRFLGYFLLFIGLGYQIQRLYKKLKIEPEIFSKESSIQSSQIPFPAVTICPPNPTRNEAWNPDFLMLNNFTRNDLLGASLQTCPNYEMHMEYQTGNVDIVDVLLKSAPNFVDVVNHCGLNNYWVNLQNCDKLFIRSITEYGICYTFNMLGHDSIFNKEVSSDFDTFRRTRIAKIWDPEQVMNESRLENDLKPPIWSIETGYLSDSDFVQPARALKMQTLVFGGLNEINDSFCEAREKNYKLMLHLPNELPQNSYETVNVPIGKEDIVQITAKMIHNEESLRNFKPEKRDCYFQGEKLLQVFKSYTKANCEYECMTSFVNLTCGCVKFSMPRTNDMKVCDFDKYDCIKSITDIFPRSYYDNYENKKKFPDYPCGCLPSCTEIKYKIIKSERKNRENEFLSNKVVHAVINVVFADSQIDKTSNYVTYEMENFIFDIGGLIGLFLGSSILSVLELFVDVCKSVKNHTERALKLLKQRTEMETNGSVHSREIEIGSEAEATRAVGMPVVRTSSGSQGSVSDSKCEHNDDLIVEDLEI